MRAQDIEVGVSYVWATWGRSTGRYATRLTDDEPIVLRAVPIAEPKDSKVECEVYRLHYDDEGEPTERHYVENEVCKLRDLLGTWADRETQRESSARYRREQIEQQREYVARMKAVLGPDVWKEHAIHLDFEVHGDGSFSTECRGLFRETMVDLLEAAFEAGQNSGAE